MPAGEFEVRILQTFDTSSLRAYVAEARQAMQQIASAAAVPVVEGGPGGIVSQRRFQEAQVATTASVQAARGVLDPHEFQQFSSVIRGIVEDARRLTGQASGYAVRELAPERLGALADRARLRQEAGAITEKAPAGATTQERADIGTQAVEQRSAIRLALAEDLAALQEVLIEDRAAAQVKVSEARAGIALGLAEDRALLSLMVAEDKNALSVNLAEVKAGLRTSYLEADTAAKQTLIDARKDAGIQLWEGKAAISEEMRARRLAEREARIAAEREARERGGFLGGLGRGFTGGLGGGGRGGGAGGGFSMGGMGEQMGQFAAFSLVYNNVFRLMGTIRESVTESEQLNKQFAVLKTQADAIGQGGGFESLRQNVLNVARDTGVSAREVANLAAEFLGLYGNVDQANTAVADAAKIILVTGVNAAQAGPQIAAMAQDLGASVQQIGNAVIDASNRTGRSTGDMLAAFSAVAPVAQEANMSLTDMRALIEAVGVTSSRTGQQIGEGLARVLPAMSKNMAKMATDVGIQFSPAAGAGDTKQALTEIVEQFHSLDRAHQQLLITIMGGPRFAQLLSGAFQNETKFLSELNRTTTDNNLLNERSKAAAESLSGAFARLKQTFQGLIEGIVRSGVGAGLKDLVEVGNAVVHVFSEVFKAFEAVNKATGGIAGQVVVLAAAFRALTFIERIPIVLGAMTQAFPRLASVVGAATGATTAETLAEQANVAVKGEEVVANEALAASETATATARTVSGAGGLLGRATGAIGGIGRFMRTGIGALGVGNEMGAGAGIYGLAAGGAVGESIGAMVGAIPIALPAAAATAIVLKIRDDENAKAKAQIEHWQTMYAGETQDQIANAFKTAQQHPDEYRKDVTPGPLLTLGFHPLGKATEAFSPQSWIGRASDIAHLRFDIHGGIPAHVGEPAKNSRLGQLLRQDREHRANQMQGMVDALIQAHALSDADQKAIQDDLTDIGDPGKYEDLNKRLIAAMGTEKGKAAFKQFVDDKRLQKAGGDAVKPLTDKTGGLITTLDEAKAAFQEGDISLDDYVQALQKEADSLANIDTPEARKKRAQDIKAIQKAKGAAVVQAAQEQTALNEEILGLGPESDVAQQHGVIASADTSPAEKAKAGETIFKDQKRILANRIRAAHSVAEKQAIAAEGIPLDKASIDAINAERALTGQAPLNVQGGKVVLTREEQIQLDNEVAAEEHKKALAKINLAKSKSRDDPIAAAQAEQKLASENLAEAERIYTKNSSQYIEAETAVQAADNNFAKAMQQVNADKRRYTDAVLQGQHNAAAVATNNLQAAQEEQSFQLQQAQAAGYGSHPMDYAPYRQAATQTQLATNQVAAQAENRTKAVEAYNKAVDQASGNRLKLAQDEKAAADNDLAVLHMSRGQVQAAIAAGTATAEMYQAAAAEVTADKSMQDYAVTLANAQIDYAAALATAAGHPGAAARDNVQKIQGELDRARARGADQASLLDLQGQLAVARTNAAQADIAENEKRIHDQLELRQISVGQAIAQLQQMSAVAQNDEQRRQIDIEIQNLMKQSAQNLQWNVPTDIHLPTLYEVRRSMGSGSAGYTDNRRVSIQLIVNNGMDANAARAMLNDALGAPVSVYGTSSRRV